MVRSSSGPQVSVIIPAYNGQAFIDKTLYSARTQTFRNIEIIIIDDGSSDRTVEIARAHGKEDSRIKLISKANQGVAAARNDGIAMARGEYIAFLDADDLWHPTKLERQLAAINTLHYGEVYAAVYSLTREIDAEDRIIRSTCYYPTEGNSFARHVFTRPVGNCSNMLVRKDAAVAVGGFDSDYLKKGLWGVEDYDFEVKIARAYAIKAMPEYLVGYRKHDHNMSADSTRMARATLHVYDRYLKGMESRMGRGKAWVYGMLHYELFCHYAKSLRLIEAVNALGLAALNDLEYLYIKAADAVSFALRQQLNGRQVLKPSKWITEREGRSFYTAPTLETSIEVPLSYMKRRYEYLSRLDKQQASEKHGSVPFRTLGAYHL